jgi:hypothetical protein
VGTSNQDWQQQATINQKFPQVSGLQRFSTLAIVSPKIEAGNKSPADFKVSISPA